VQVDQLAALELRVEALKEELKTAETVYKKALAPILEYVNASIEPEQGMNLTGKTAIIEFGRQRAVRKLLDPIKALLKLERVEPGLGYKHISIPIAVLDKYLRPAEAEDLYGLEYGARNVKVTVITK
jgi:hypothetical protein